MSVQWFGKKVTKQFKAETLMKFGKAGALIEGKVKDKLKVKQPTRTTKDGHTVGLDPSKSGSPPKIVTNQLRQSITYETGMSGNTFITNIGVEKGSPAEKYALVLEYEAGLNRPYLRSTISGNMKEIRRVILG